MWEHLKFLYGLNLWAKMPNKGLDILKGKYREYILLENTLTDTRTNNRKYKKYQYEQHESHQNPGEHKYFGRLIIPYVIHDEL